MYDAVAEAVPLAQSGRHRKKALLIISDGNDTNSATTVLEVKRQIRETEVLVYAIGIDGQSDTATWGQWRAAGGPRQPPPPLPVSASDARWRRPATASPDAPYGPARERGMDDRVNACRAARDHRRQRRPHRNRPLRARSRSGHRGHRRRIEPAVFARLSRDRQSDGRWHSIGVEVRGSAYRVRARRGYVATP